MISLAIALAVAVAVATPSSAKPEHPHGGPPGLERKGGVPPGQAKKMPPGLAKKYGRVVDQPVYVALDPVRDDRAWFLVDGRWQVRSGFDSRVRAEVRASLALPFAAPPVPPPGGRLDLRIVLFD